jgi:serine/threonine protein phosphatase PrpC
LKNQYIAACVIDGVGGYEGGEVAARIAHDVILDYFRIPSGDMVTMMKEAVKAANEKIYQAKQQQQQYNSMACVLTMAVADIKNNKFFYAHVGDTRLYLLRDHTLIKITKDHSFVGFLEDNGKLTEEAAMQHPKRNEINKALGFDANIGIHTDYIETGESPFLPGDMLLLCSDGLTDMINNRQITALIDNELSLEDKAKSLVEAANSAGGKDNITVVLVHNNKKPVKRTATKPPLIEKKNQSVQPVSEKKTDKPQLKETLKPVPRKSNKALVPALAVLCLLFLLMFVWQLVKNNRGTSGKIKSEINRNTREQQLLDSLQHSSGTTVVLNTSGAEKTITVTDTLHLQQDSLYVQGNGMVLQRDPRYTGPALATPAGAKYIVLENIIFQDFDIGVFAQSNMLQLRNVQFVNCRIPVLYSFSFPENQPVTTTITDIEQNMTDSLPTKQLRK